LIYYKVEEIDLAIGASRGGGIAFEARLAEESKPDS